MKNVFTIKPLDFNPIEDGYFQAFAGNTIAYVMLVNTGKWYAAVNTYVLGVNYNTEVEAKQACKDFYEKQIKQHLISVIDLTTKPT